MSAIWNNNEAHCFDASICPQDTVSCMKWAPNSNMLAVTSWDKNIRVYDVQTQQQASKLAWNVVPKASKEIEAPMLSCAWSSDASKLYTAGCDNKVHMWNPADGSLNQIGQHAKPINHIFEVPALNCVVSGSWDNTIKFWDIRSPKEIQSLDLPGKCYSMDVKDRYLVVSCSNRQFGVVDLQSPDKFMQLPDKLTKAQIEHDIRSVSLITDNLGFAYGSTEGRVQVCYFEESKAKKRESFSFKCHRNPPGTATKVDCYPVNHLEFHPKQHTFISCGGDGNWCIWDLLAKKKKKSSPKYDQSINTCSFNAEGNILAYSTGYDWLKGHEYYESSGKKFQIYLRAVGDTEINDGVKLL
eukprot:TRINITY_DN81915_c0_g3_i1.p1 TRINITY_DN81915_c0_g3~~TRINITY_DN81915_c0_g3_i1.p1  ORF type:complete len:370 (-),score=91.41 TRINITY_DN81915_c0_g3_i1:241-1305(-)